MKGSWRLIALAAGGLFLGGAHGAQADHQRSGHDRDDQGYRYQRSGWHTDRDEERAGRHERHPRGWPLEGRDDRFDNRNYDYERRDRWHSEEADRARERRWREEHHSQAPFAYIRAADAHHRSAEGDHPHGRDGRR